MRLYSEHILPNLVHFVCGLRAAMLQRGKVIPFACGRVLEVGVGSGLNFSYYDAAKVRKLWGLDPSPAMLKRAKLRARSAKFPIQFIAMPGEKIPLASNSVDTVVVTYTLCTISNVDLALQEMARVLKAEGELVFCEHGAAPDAYIRWWQNRLNPLWKCLGGGCHLNREIPKLIEQNGFRIRQMQASYIDGWRPASYNYWGRATLARGPKPGSGVVPS